MRERERGSEGEYIFLVLSVCVSMYRGSGITIRLLSFPPDGCVCIVLCATLYCCACTYLCVY